MSNEPASLVFVKNIAASKIFWTQLVGLAAIIASAAGVHVLDSAATQVEVVAAAMGIVTGVLRYWFPTGPVSVTAPLSIPAPSRLDVGTHTVTVLGPPPPAPKPAAMRAIVTPVILPVVPPVPVVAGAPAPTPLV